MDPVKHELFQQITIFGENAGGQSVTMRLMSTRSRSLFKQAIIQSYRAAISYQNVEESLKRTEMKCCVVLWHFLTTKVL